MKRLAAGSVIRFVVSHPWLTAAMGVGTIVIITAVVVVSGVVPAKASSGHWPITHNLLDFAKVRSVAWNSSGIKVPPLDDHRLVVRGAAHYEIGCAVCHGSPSARVPSVMVKMTPPPPELSGPVGRWKAEELFYIVKYGVKYTGMPGWPVQERDDEVWAMVAFLRKMPGLDAASYQALAYGEASDDVLGGLAASIQPPPPQPVREICSRCHGVDGRGGPAEAFPRLAGQQADYLYRALRGFAERKRLSGTMGAVAATLDDRSMREIASYYAALPSNALPAPATGAASTRRGEQIATRGVPDRDIPACRKCHGPTEERRNTAYPNLAGQHTDYLKSQIRLLQQRRRGGGGYENLMHKFVGRLLPEDIEVVTRYYSSLGR